MNHTEKTATTSLLATVKSHMAENGMGELPGASPRVGIALSGGADSMALLHIAISLGWTPVALHCNFGLRGAESDRDEAFVTRHCAKSGIELHKTRFDVGARTGHTGESVEMACRELRYDWFAQMAIEKKLAAIALGHHRDDNVETFLLNILRGCGTGGAKGIPSRRGIYIRPLLPLSREEIRRYLTENGIDHITDSSNLSNDYSRNKIRNLILPALEECFPGGTSRIDTSIRHIAADNRLLRALVEEKRDAYISADGRICLRQLLDHEPEGTTLLYHLLDGDLDAEAIRKLAASTGASGKFITGRSGRRYLLDRGALIPITATGPADADSETEHLLEIDPEKLPRGGEATIITTRDGTTLRAGIISRKDFAPRRDPAFAWFDSALLDSPSPLTLHHPRTGQRITPFGMKGSRLLSDIFSDMKMPVTDKHSQWVMSSGPDTIWIAGVKNSALYPITPSTENILMFHMVKSGEKS